MNKELMDSLDAYIEYAERTKKFADVGFYERLREHITYLEDKTIFVGVDPSRDYTNELKARGIRDAIDLVESQGGWMNGGGDSIFISKGPLLSYADRLEIKEEWV